MQKVILLLVLTGLTLFGIQSCRMSYSAEQMLGFTRTQVTEQIDKLVADGDLTGEEANLLRQRLLGDIETFLAAEKMTAEEVLNMAMVSLDTIGTRIKVDEFIFAPIQQAYTGLQGAAVMTHLNSDNPQHTSNVAAAIWQWFNDSQDDADRFEALRKRTRRITELNNEEKHLPAGVMQRLEENLLRDIDRIEADTTLTDEEIHSIVTATMQEYEYLQENYVLTSAMQVYQLLGDLRDVDTSDELMAWIGITEDSMHPDYFEMTDEELRSTVTARIEFMHEEGLIGRGDYTTLKNTMPSDIGYFLSENHTPSDLEKQAEKSLKKLARLHLDTEDREFIAEVYYDLGRRKGLEEVFGNKLMEWLYGKDLADLARSMQEAADE